MEFRRISDRWVAIAIFSFVFMVTRAAYAIRPEFGVIAFALLGPLLLLKELRSLNPIILVGVYSLYFAGRVFYSVTIDPILGPDETRFFEQSLEFPTVEGFLRYVFGEILIDLKTRPSSVPIFGLLTIPFSKLFGSTDPQVGVIFNNLCHLLLIKVLFRMVSVVFKEYNPQLAAILVCFLMVSSNFLHYSNIYAKDVCTTLIGVLAAYLLSKKKFIPAILATIYVTGLRPYAIVFILIYFAFTNRSNRYFYFGLVFTCLVVALSSDSLSLPLSCLKVFGFMFLSPNPLNIENWNSHFIFMVIETSLMIPLFVASIIIFLFKPDARPILLRVWMAAFCYACVLALLGENRMNIDSYVILDANVGDNMVRKKLPIMPLIYLSYVYTLWRLLSLKTGERTWEARTVKELQAKMSSIQKVGNAV